MSVYIIRHGESLANLHPDLARKPEYDGIQDRDVPLSEWGQKQAVEAGKALRGELEAAAGAGRKLVVLHSPFLRTIQTMHGVLQGAGLSDSAQPVAHEDVQEQCFGIFDCITDRHLIAKLWPKEHAEFVAARQKDKHHARAPGGESRADVVERAKRFISDHAADFSDPNTDVIVVGHGLVNRAVEMCLRNQDIEWLRKEPNPTNCAIRKLEGDLLHGYSKAEYIHEGKERPAHLPKDYQTRPFGQQQVAMAL